MTGHDKENEGEGSREAAEAYNRQTKEFVETGNVDKAARDAAAALDTKEADDLKKAEELGRAHAKDEDPQVRRDR